MIIAKRAIVEYMAVVGKKVDLNNIKVRSGLPYSYTVEPAGATHMYRSDEEPYIRFMVAFWEARRGSDFTVVSVDPVTGEVLSIEGMESARI